ncbi:DUF6397 family protein [Streptomyces corynorhini]|uniref:DUF6397 family protein n=1 Tax=Streptomyces corynorhini TaxID=2282652 RepID=UPI0018F51EFE|nr:DUF6397 family protein [Streptomyces corynorhini]
MSVGDAGIRKPETVGVDRAAQELELRRGEFALAAQLGHIRTVAGPVLGRRQVARQEIDRLRAADGFPGALRERVRTVGTAEGAELMSVSPGRFTRLARAGFVAPVTFYLNRYRAVVWLYLADDLRAFVDTEPVLLTGRFPQALRAGLDAGEDRRARNWRGRRVGLLLHESDDAWERAAVAGCVLDPAHLAELVRDPYERAYLNRLRPDLAEARSASEAAREVVRRLVVADAPDEIRWHHVGLESLLAEARSVRPAPRPDDPGAAAPADRRATTAPRPPGGHAPSRAERRGRLLARLRIGRHTRSGRLGPGRADVCARDGEPKRGRGGAGW